MANDRIIPNWIGRTDPSGQIRPQASGVLQRGSKPQIIQTQTIAEDAIIPIVYGGPERIAGMPYTICLASNGIDLLVSFILCEGEIESIGSVEVNNQAATGITFSSYRGTQVQVLDPDLAAAIPGFNERMLGTAYLVGRFPPGTVNGMPQVTAEVTGLRIPDPRIGNAIGPWTNPALILAHFMRTYARRQCVDANINFAANQCDVLVGGLPRCTLTITLAEARSADEWIEVLRGYLPAWVNYQNNEWWIVPDIANAPVASYDADTDNKTDGEAPLALFKRGARDVPNIIEVVYTETSIKPWTEKKAVAVLPGIGTGQKRKATISMPGIRTLAQAYRFAVERLNHFTLESIEGELAVMDDGLAILPGDIISITDAAHGWAAKQVRVLAIAERDNGRWGIRFREYDPAAYSTDAPASPPAPNSGTLPNPLNVQSVVGLAAVESLKFEQAGDTAGTALARGLIWQSRITATWTASADPFADFYEIKIEGAPIAQPMLSTSKLPQFCSSTLVQGASYAVSVRVINSIGLASAWVSVAVAVNGKITPPGDVTQVTFAQEIGGEAILRWIPVADLDVVRYEWRALATAAATAAWDSMAMVDRPDTNYTRIKGLSPGPTLFAIKAVDSVGRYSINAYYVNLTITSDASAFLQTFDFVPQLNVHIVRYHTPLIEGSSARPLPRWITAGDVPWNTAMPNPVASGVPPVVVAGYGRNSNWAVSCNTWDFGLVLEATIKVNLSWLRSLRGNCYWYLPTSLDGVNWDWTHWASFAPGAALGWISKAITARYVRLDFYNSGALLTDAMMIEGAIQAQVSSSTRSESGTAKSNASGPLRVNLAAKYTRAVAIVITVKGTTSATEIFDNVIVGLSTTPNSFDVYIFNSSGVQDARDFSWRFEGV